MADVVKRGTLFKRSSSMFSKWHKKYVVVTTTELQVYEKEGDREPKSRMGLRDVLADEDDTGKKEFMNAFHVIGFRNFTFRCSTQQERKEWLFAVRSVVSSLEEDLEEFTVNPGGIYVPKIKRAISGGPARPLGGHDDDRLRRNSLDENVARWIDHQREKNDDEDLAPVPQFMSFVAGHSLASVSTDAHDSSDDKRRNVLGGHRRTASATQCTPSDADMSEEMKEEGDPIMSRRAAIMKEDVARRKRRNLRGNTDVSDLLLQDHDKCLCQQLLRYLDAIRTPTNETRDIPPTRRVVIEVTFNLEKRLLAFSSLDDGVSITSTLQDIFGLPSDVGLILSDEFGAACVISGLLAPGNYCLEVRPRSGSYIGTGASAVCERLTLRRARGGTKGSAMSSPRRKQVAKPRRPPFPPELHIPSYPELMSQRKAKSYQRRFSRDAVSDGRAHVAAELARRRRSRTSAKPPLVVVASYEDDSPRTADIPATPDPLTQLEFGSPPVT